MNCAGVDVEGGGYDGGARKRRKERLQSREMAALSLLSFFFFFFDEKQATADENCRGSSTEMHRIEAQRAESRCECIAELVGGQSTPRVLDAD